MNFINTPILRVKCLNVENPRPINFGHFYLKCKFTTQKPEHKSAMLKIGFSTFRQLTLNTGVFIDIMGSYNCNYLKIAMGEGDFRGT